MWAAVFLWMIYMKSCLTAWCWCWSPRLSWSMREMIHLRQTPDQTSLRRNKRTFTRFQLYTFICDLPLCLFCLWMTAALEKERKPLEWGGTLPLWGQKTKKQRRLCVNTEQYNMITQPSCTVEEGDLTLCFQIGLPQWCWSKINNGKFEFNPLFPKMYWNH